MNPLVRDHIAQKYGLGDEVRKAQQTAAELQLANDLSRAGATVGAALSPGIKVDQGYWDSKAAQSRQLVQNVLARQEAADSDAERRRRDSLADPNNKLAQLARKKLKEIGYDVDEGMSLVDLKAAGIEPFALFDKAKQREYEKKLREEERKTREAERQADRELRQQEYQDRREERELIRQERKAEREEKVLEKREQDLRKREVPGVGIAMTEQDAKDLKQATEMKAKFDRMIDEMIALRKKHDGGAVLNREDVARGKQLSKDLLLTYKDLAKLGVLSQSDEAILNRIIPEDPLEFNVSGIFGQDPTMARLEKFKQDSEKDYQARLATRLESRFQSPQTASEPKLQYSPGSRIKVRGQWYVVGEDGDTLIPENQMAQVNPQ